MAGAHIRDALRQVHRLFAVGTVAGLSDAALLSRFTTGHDEGAFAALVSRHGPMVLSVCQGVLRDPRDVEDAFQATFLVLVRRAGRIWVNDSLGGWLHRVAYRVAVQARADAARRAARERREASMDAIEGRDRAAGHIPAPEVHEEIARLPESYRRAVVLCYLEGMTHVQAARELRCGEATLRRRLAGARERLRTRLERRGLVSVFTLSETHPPLPVDWVEATARAAVAGASGRPVSAAVGRLAGVVLSVMTRARRLRAVAGLLGLSATCAFGYVAFAAQETPPNPERPAVVIKPVVKDAEAPAPPVRPGPRWVHLKSDTFTGETWGCMDDAREFTREGKKITLADSVANKLYTYDGGDQITCVNGGVGVTYHGKDGKPMPRCGLELLYEPGTVPKRATERERREDQVFTDYEIEVIVGRKLGRLDQYVRDALGEARVDNQTWFDLESKLPVRKRRRLQVAYQHEYKREFSTTLYDYPATGPADLFALGVPEGTQIVVKYKKTTTKLDELPPDVRRCIRGAAEALRRFPHDFRALTLGSISQLEYWSCPPSWMDLRCDALRDGFQPAFDDDHRPLHFRADNQEPGGLKPEKGLKLQGERLTDWLCERFPIDKSVNIGLEDGKRTYHLTRFFVAQDKPRREQLHILGGSFPDELPRLLDDQWPYANWGYARLSLPPPEPDTPAGQIVIKYEQQDFRQLFYCDPARDFIAVKRVEWSRWKDPNGAWGNKVEWTAARTEQLPNGSWYVSAWDHTQTGRVTGVDAGGKPVSFDQEMKDRRTVAITPMPRDRFPKDIFNGETLLEGARKRGATVEVDR